MANIVFVYGTLMYPIIVKALTGKTFDMEDAILTGFERHTLNVREKAKPPAIRKKSGKNVAGKILKDVDSSSLEIFDNFEDIKEGCYKREVVSVKTFNGSFSNAITYIAKDKMLNKLEGNWSPEKFEAVWMEYYLAHVLENFLRQN